jgi:nicotinamidase-related amidase
MSKKIAFIGIDLQKDFHDIAGAALPVGGAVKDTERMCILIDKMNPLTIFTSMDSHYSLDISHAAWWKKPNGTNVEPFTLISPEDVKNGTYTAVIDPTRSLKYLEDLKANGEFMHFIWPDHCLMGSDGYALLPMYLDTLNKWMHRRKKWVNFITKGVNPYTEHFGIFRANVPDTSDPNTQVNQGIFQALNAHDELYLYGEARTHCVVNSLKQMLEIAPQLASKLYVVEDATSNVGGLPQDFYDHVDNLYKDAASKGVQFVKTTDF